MSGVEKYSGFLQKDIAGVGGNRALPSYVDVPFPEQQCVKRYDPAFEIKVSSLDEDPVGRNIVVKAWKDPQHALAMRFYVNQKALATMPTVTRKALISAWLRQVEEYLEEAIDMGAL